MQNLPVRRRVTGFIVAAIIGAAAPSSAQTAPAFSSPSLPADHWAVEAARRAASLGLAPADFAWGDGTLTQGAAGWALREASARAAAVKSPLQATVASDWHRFAREFPATAARLGGAAGQPAPSPRRTARTPRLPVGSSMSARFVSADGRLLPVRSRDRTRENVSPPQPLRDLSDVELDLRVWALLGPHAAAEVGGGRSGEEWRLRNWQVAAGARSLGAWVGQRAPDFGPGAGGGLVFDGRATFAGGGIALTNPVRPPWILRHLGWARGEAFLSRIDSSAATRHPWVFGSHASLTPHPRLLIGATQAFMFSGEGLPPFTWRNFKEMFLTHGIKTAGREFENGIASVEARWRPPVPRLPAVLYVEWGTDDNHSAWFRFPAVVAGVSLPAVPRVPALSLGLERTSFARPCTGCGGCACEYYATWYRHYVFMDGWTLDRQPIGHPLGGDGTEWLAYGRYDDAAHRIRLDARAFARERGRYNLYAPAREGRSAGASLGAEYRVGDALELEVHGSLERGRRDWHTAALSAGLRWLP